MMHRGLLKTRYSSRGAHPDDVGRLVDVDLVAFRSVYKHYDMPETELRNNLIGLFSLRLDTVGPSWFRIAEKGGKIHGFLVSCPTARTPEGFESWLDVTDSGTLTSTYNRAGPNVYIASLSMLPSADEGARNMLVVYTMGKAIGGGYQQVFFESRLPGLLSWARRRCRDQGRDMKSLTDQERLELAKTYFQSRCEVKGKQLHLDPLLRIYTKVGCTFSNVLPNAYADVQSMNFGAVGIWRNPLPEVLRRSRIAGKLMGGLLCALSRSHRLMGKAFS